MMTAAGKKLRRLKDRCRRSGGHVMKSGACVKCGSTGKVGRPLSNIADEIDAEPERPSAPAELLRIVTRASVSGDAEPAPPPEPEPEPVTPTAAELADGPGLPPSSADPTAAVNAGGLAWLAINAEAAGMVAQDGPQTAQDAPRATETASAGESASSGEPAAAINAEAAGMAGGAASPAGPKVKPSVMIPNAIARAGIAGGLAWLATKGSAYAVRRFGPRGKNGERFRPGPETIPVSDEALDKFGVSLAERRELGVTPETPLQFPVSDVLAEGVRVEMERLGFERDLAIHPLLVIAAGLIAIPACQIIRSPDFLDDGDEGEPERGNDLADRAGSFDARPTPEHAPRNVPERRAVQSLAELRGPRRREPDAAE